MPVQTEIPIDWLIWQLADSAFPTGSFAHSGGLEAAVQNGEIQTRQDLRQFLQAALQQTARASLPFVRAAFEHEHPLEHLDRLCDAFISNHIANRASRLQGRAFLNAALRAFPRIEIPPPPFCHLAPITGAVLASLNLEYLAAIRLFLFNQLRGWISAAVRLNVIGPLEAQNLQASLAPFAESLLHSNYPLADAAQTAPLIEILQAGQERLYSRLFQS